MKATRKLIPAFAMLLIAAVMMSTATFAWFTTNGTVGATGITVNAKANNTYLIINDTGSFTETAETLPDLRNVTLTTNNTGNLYPVSWAGTTSSALWKSGVGTSYTVGTASGALTEVAAGKGTHYVELSLFIKVANGYEDAKNLKLKSATATGAAAVVVSNKAGNKFNWQTNGTSQVLENGVALYDTVSSGTAVEVIVRVYIDGDNALITNENYDKAALNGMTMALVFECGETVAP